MPRASDLPSPWEEPGGGDIDVDGRPGWLIAGGCEYEQPAVVAPAGAAPAIVPGPGSSAPASHSRAPHAHRSTVPGALELDAAAIAARPRMSQHPAAAGPHAHRAVGHVVGREAPPELPMVLRLALRAGLGLSLFMIAIALRSAFDTDVSEARAAWSEAPELESSVQPVFAPPARPASAADHGPRALEWMGSDFHQFTNPDKDAVRSKVKAYKAAGAVEVYVGNIARSGPLQIAGELIVELPGDAAQREAVLAEHQRAVSSTFGGLSAKVRDPGGALLRITL